MDDDLTFDYAGNEGPDRIHEHEAAYWADMVAWVASDLPPPVLR